jgi:hypothetical protein
MATKRRGPSAGAAQMEVHGMGSEARCRRRFFSSAALRRGAAAFGGVSAALAIGVSALGQVVTDPTGRVCVATDTDSCTAQDAAVATGGGTAVGSAAVAPQGGASGKQIAVGMSSASATWGLPFLSLVTAVALSGPASVCDASIYPWWGEFAISVFGNSSTCAQGTAVSVFGSADALGIAISGTGPATSRYNTGPAAISGTGPANDSGGTLVISGTNVASNGALAVGGGGASGGYVSVSPNGNASGSEVAISGTGSASACGGPAPLALAPLALINAATIYTCSGGVLPPPL